MNTSRYLTFATVLGLAAWVVPRVEAAITMAPGSVSMQQGSMTTTGAAGDIRALLAGFDAYNGTGPSNYALDLTAYADASNQVALRGWIATGGVPVPAPGENSPYYLGLNLRNVPGGDWNQREQLTVNFASERLGNWHGVNAVPWERLRLEYTQADEPPYLESSSNALGANDGEEWYILEGGTSDNNTTIYPSDRMYYVQMLMNLDTNEVELQVWGKGNPGDQAPPNSNNSVDYKQWYTAAQTWDLDTISGFEFDPTQVGVEFYLATTGHLGPDESATVIWKDFEIGGPMSTALAPPLSVVMPEPVTAGLLILGAAGLVRPWLLRSGRG